MPCVQPLHKELYELDPATTFVPAFLEAVNENTEESFKRICSEPSPGIYTFEMFQPRFCELLLAEVLAISTLVSAIICNISVIL